MKPGFFCPNSLAHSDANKLPPKRSLSLEALVLGHETKIHEEDTFTCGGSVGFLLALKEKDWGWLFIEAIFLSCCG